MSERMRAREIGVRLRAILRGIGIENDPLGPGKTITISFTEQYDLCSGLRIYVDGKQVIGIETLEANAPATKRKARPAARRTGERDGRD